jgi:glycosyltransferase involved in cell wall biosynthesis
MTAPLSYAIVTPARNEAENLRALADSLARQTLLPTAWVIVDSDSADETAAVAEELARTHDWIDARSLSGQDGPTRARAIVRGFQAGLAALGKAPDVVVKLDADITVNRDYFARLVAEFAADPKLGIASGTCYERRDGAWEQRHVTGAHVWGASRAYRWDCLHDVLPLEERLGWDGIDEMKAGLRGWRTGTFVELPFYHHRREGEREGHRMRAWRTAGDAAYYIGYRPDYLVLRSLHYARHDPTAVAMIAGYAAAAIRRAPRCPDDAVRAYVRRQQALRNIPLRMREALGRRS